MRPWKALLLGAAVLLIVAWESSEIPHYANECNYDEAGQKYCTGYHIALYVPWKLAEFFDSHNGTFSALFAAAVAWFTWRLWKTTKGMLKATGRQLDFIESEFIATHRPQIIVRGVSLWNENQLIQNNRAQIWITAINAGETDALISEIKARAFVVRPADTINVGQDFHEIDLGKRPPLASGENAQFGLRIDTALTTLQIIDINAGKLDLLCVGYVAYRSKTGSFGLTGFARKLHPKSRRFLPIDDPEYEFRY